MFVLGKYNRRKFFSNERNEVPNILREIVGKIKIEAI